MSDQTASSLGILRLLQLASSNLPVGGYTFSQGLEYAIDAGWLRSQEQVKDWIAHVTSSTLVYSDLPLIARQYMAIDQKDWKILESWNDVALAIRETRELALADTAMGDALLRLANGMSISLPPCCSKEGKAISFVTIYSVVASFMELNETEALTAYAWTVLENQVLAATKLLPMGQTAAQRMLHELSASISEVVEKAKYIEDKYLGVSLPGLVMASAYHETQYSRLYRS